MPVRRRLLPSSITEQSSADSRPLDYSEPRLLRIPQVAKYLNTSSWQVRELLRSGQLPKIKLGKTFLVDRLDAEALIQKLKGRAA